MKTTKKNVSLAVSLAKEKSRNEKLMAVQQELVASRNEALMRLNETEASFDRMGIAIKRGIRQLHEMAKSMEDLFVDISRSQKSLRDSAITRSSLRTKSHRKRAAPSGTSKTQTVNPMVGGHTIITHPRISLSRIDDFQENGPSDRAQNQVLVTSVSVMKEESEATSSNTDSSDEEVELQPRRETMREFYERAYAQDAQEGPSSRRACRRRPARPRYAHRVPPHSSSDECDSHHVGGARLAPPPPPPATATLPSPRSDSPDFLGFTSDESRSSAAKKPRHSVAILSETTESTPGGPPGSKSDPLATPTTSCPSVDRLGPLRSVSPKVCESTVVPSSPTKSCAVLLSNIHSVKPSPSPTSSQLPSASPKVCESPSPTSSQTPSASPKVCESTVVPSTPTKSCAVLLSNIDSVKLSPSPTSSQTPSASPKVCESTLISSTPTKSCTVLLSNIDSVKPSPSPTSSQLPSASPKVCESVQRVNSSTPTKSCTVLLSNIDSVKPSPSPTPSKTPPASPKLHASIGLFSNCAVSTASSGRNTQPSSIVHLEHLQSENDSVPEGSVTIVTWGSRPATPLQPLLAKRTQSAKECKRVLTVELERLPAMSRKAEPLRNSKRQKLKIPDCCSNVENATLRPRRRGKQTASFSLDPSDGPRGVSKIPNLRALVKQIDESCKINDLRANEDQGARKALRKIAPTNDKEPRNLRHRRRPLLKT